MIKVYLKQAWTLMKQNKLFTSIYVVGTGISIMLVMVLFITYYIKIAPVYPEYKRGELLALKRMKITAENFQSSGGVSYIMLRDLFPKMKHLEAVAATGYGTKQVSTSLPGEKEQRSFFIEHVNDEFWKVFDFEFTDGKPFTSADYNSGLSKVVISEYTALSLFATTQAAGKEIDIYGRTFQICGVVKDVSGLTTTTAADMWVPLTVEASNTDTRDQTLRGNLAYYLLPKPGEKEALREEVRQTVRTYDMAYKEFKSDLMGQPDDYWVGMFRVWSNVSPKLKDHFLPIMGVVLFLLIPAFNLCSMTTSRMDQRLCEMGIRKSFGARRSTLLSQVLLENLLLTCLGGLLGLLFSYVFLVLSKDWVFTLFDSFVTENVRTIVTPEMLFHPVVFLVTFGVCVLMNLLSAFIPALLSLRRPIVLSLNSKK